MWRQGAVGRAEREPYEHCARLHGQLPLALLCREDRWRSRKGSAPSAGRRRSGALVARRRDHYRLSARRSLATERSGLRVLGRPCVAATLAVDRHLGIVCRAGASDREVGAPHPWAGGRALASRPCVHELARPRARHCHVRCHSRRPERRPARLADRVRLGRCQLDRGPSGIGSTACQAEVPPPR